MKIVWFLWRGVFPLIGYFAIGVLLLLHSPINLKAQAPFTPEITEVLNENWRWRSMEVLAAKGVRCMADDHEGNMWFGLDKGIIRYDGYNWKLFDDKAFLRSPVGILYLSKEGRIFAGSDAGLLVFENGTWEKIFPKSDSVQISVTSITETPDGKILAGIQNGLLIVENERNVSIFTVLSRVNSFREINPVSKVCVLPDEILFQRNFGRIDNVYVGDNGLIWVLMSRNNDGKLLKFNIADTLNHILHKFEIKDELGGFKLPNRNELLKTQGGELWVINGFYKSGILLFRNNNWELLKLSSKFGGDELHTDIIELSDGSIWIGGLGKLYVYKSGKWSVFSAPSLPIPSSRIILHESRDGQVWIAGMQGEVFKFSVDNLKWNKYKGLNFQYKDKNSREWFIGVDGRIIVNDDNHWTAYDIRNGLIDAPVRLVATNKGRIWVAGSHKGLAATAYLQDGKWIKQIHDELSWGIDPRSVFQDKDGSLWFGASVDRQEALGQISGVLQLFNPDGVDLEWKHHTNQDGIGQHNVYGIGQSPDGMLWLGGTNLLKLEETRWQTLKENEYLNEFVDIVHSKSNLWVGSRYYGLFRFDGNEWTHFTNVDGLPSNTIISIFEENPDKVWTITDRDIACFDGQRWFSGLFTVDFRLPREGAEILVDHEGVIWINKSIREWKRRAFPFSVVPSEAMEDFWTVKYVRGDKPPKTKIVIYSEKVDRSGNTLIGWTGNDFWEETPSDMLTYSYRINQGDWSPFSHETSVLLTNLGSGKYEFEVRARDLDFNIETEPARVIFTVLPPIWKQTWFITLLIAFLIVIGFYEARLINRNRSLYKLNTNLRDANETLENRQIKIERQTQTILKQKEELEKKTDILEEQNVEIIAHRDQLKEMVEKVEELSNVKQKFFMNISHEFRIPLTLILGSIERLLTSDENPGKNTLNRAYETIHRNSKRILRLINQILEVRRIETGTLELEPFRGDIVSFTREIVFLFNDLARSQVINLQFESRIGSLEANFDHDIIEKILFNLISNAFKNTPPGGRILIRVSQQEGITNDKGFLISEQDENVKGSLVNKVVIEVIDTGKGISAQHLPYIFDRFYIVKGDSRHPKFDSSGIGLSYVKDLVGNHKGTIRVKSLPGEGSNFTFEIPCNCVSEIELNENPLEYNPLMHISKDVISEIENLTRAIAFIPEETGGSLNEAGLFNESSDKLLILVVEDDLELREFLRENLEQDFDVIDAKNGVIGYSKATDYQPDIIITDVMMPEMDGLELCRRLKDNIATNHIPIIILTARATAGYKMEGYQVGADAYIEKPFSSEYLRIRIKNLIKATDKTREKTLRDLITQPSEIEVRSEDDKMLKKIQEVLEDNVSNSEFDVESMSQFFFLSRYHFSRKIKQITGLTPKEIIDSYRLKRAGQLLHQKITVTEVAYMVGFDHPNSFSRAFRKYYKMTPTEFASQKK
jgi:signal transduction histidine kinase/DNA-binding response OmpR family regulator/ligand-binding sensor domain-containing protein